MRTSLRYSLCMTILIIAFAGSAHAQSKITFNLNLKPMLEDSTFIPGRDIAEVTGDLYPLGRNRNVRLYDRDPIDSVYTAEVTFPRSAMGKQLEWNFVLTINQNTRREDMVRRLGLRGDKELDPFYFNAFAW